MLSEAEPALLTELCATLMRESTPNNKSNDGDARRNTTPTATTHRAAPTARPLQQHPRTIRATTPAPFAQRRRQVTAGVRKAGATAGSTDRGGPLGSRSVNANNGYAASSSAGIGGGGGSGNGEGLRPNNKGRRLDGTPTKAVGGSDSGGVARKSTRKVSPKKGARAPRELYLSKDQQRAVDLVVEGKSVFFTGEREIKGVVDRRGGWRKGRGVTCGNNAEWCKLCGYLW